MSSTTALGVQHAMRPVEIATFRNAWGWSPSIWRRLAGDDWNHNDAELTRLWQSIEELPEWQQIPLVLTFDTGIIPRAEYAQAADALAEFDRRLPSPPGHVNHLPGMADVLRGDPPYPWFGVWGTSVTDNPFDPWDEQADEPVGGLSLSAGSVYVLERHRHHLGNDRATGNTPGNEQGER